MVLLVIVAGILIGLSLGALGGGGSILTVPVLVYLLGMDAYQATTASLIIVGTTSLFALIPHARRGHVRAASGLVFGVVGIAGSLLGAQAAARIAGPVLLGGFALLMLVVAALMLRRASRPVGLDEEAPTQPMLTLRPLRCQCPRVLKLVVAATVVGFLTGFFGVGGGFALVPALVLALGFPMPTAVGTSLLVIGVNSVTALTTRLSTGLSLDWPVVIGFTAVAVLASLAAGQLATRVSQRALTRSFAAVLVMVALGMGGHTLVSVL